jgi:putative Mg2+ transporter-C (MgtC) family protein
MLSHEQVVFRLVLAAVLGGFVGLERERLDWAAGLRTHMLVCLGASLFMIVSSFGFMDIINHDHVSLDPSRVAAQVVSGIGFLGAGTIMFRRDVILGLTTAASLWAIAAVGLAVGGGLYTCALITTLLIVVILAWIKPVEKRLFQNRRPRALRLVVEREASLFEVESAITAANLHLKQIIVRHGDTPQVHRVEVILSRAHQKNLLPLIEKLRALPGVKEVNSLNL